MSYSNRTSYTLNTNRTSTPKETFRDLFPEHLESFDVLAQRLTKWCQVLYTVPYGAAESVAFLEVLSAFDNALHSMEQLRNAVRSKLPEKMP